MIRDVQTARRAEGQASSKQQTKGDIHKVVKTDDCNSPPHVLPSRLSRLQPPRTTLVGIAHIISGKGIVRPVDAHAPCPNIIGHGRIPLSGEGCAIQGVLIIGGRVGEGIPDGTHVAPHLAGPWLPRPSP